MPNPLVGIAGASLAGSVSQSRSASRAASAQTAAAERGITEQRAAREAFEQRTEPFRQAGLAGLTPILDLLGISVPGDLTSATSGAPTSQQTRDAQTQLTAIDDQLATLRAEEGQPRGAQSGPNRSTARIIRNRDIKNLESQRGQLEGQIAEFREQDVLAAPGAAPTQGIAQTPDALLSQINPLVGFLRQEGFEDIQESAAAQGRLRSGGTLQDLTRFNTQLASTVVPQLQQQRFNQLFNLIGLGQNAAAGQGQASLQTAGNISNLLGNIGQAQAGGAIGQGQAIQGAASQFAGLLGAQQAGLFNQPQSGGLFDTGVQTDFATGAQSSPLPSTFGGGF